MVSRSVTCTILLLLLLSCRHEPLAPDPEVSYTFFVAGHTYGNRQDAATGFHPPFKAQFPLLHSRAKYIALVN